jgi:glycosyltransferase involved in cell wall biosynthesis
VASYPYNDSVSSPSLSIVIPTHKRAEILKKCMEHLEKQTIAKQLEVIVVSDGHDEETSALMKHIAKSEHSAKPSLAGFRFLELDKCQQGIARNRGVEHASAKYVLFIGDDIFLTPEACEKHVHAHVSYERSALSSEQKESVMKNPIAQSSKLKAQDLAVLGFTTWDPALEITSVMRWLEATGWQFGYPFLEPYRSAIVPPEVQHRFTYTSHISLPTAVAKRTPFREDVTLYGWEDIEWGLRLRDSGVGLFYEPDAKAFHHHHLTLEQSLKRMQELGESAVFLTRIAPELDRLPKGWKRWAYKILALLPTMRGKHARAFLEGIMKGEKA